MRTQDRTRAGEAYLAGLLHDLGRFAMVERHGSRYLQYCGTNANLSEAELFGETHEEVMEPSTLAVLTALRAECRLHGGSVTVEIGRSLWATRAATT